MKHQHEFGQLLAEFDHLPKLVRQPTYLELCQYPTRRFEEICSKMLGFFFSPKNDHGFNDLFIMSLIQLIGETTELNYKSERLKIVLEDNADGKRIDLVIAGDNFVIGIENKITADLYNPLDIYIRKLKKYSKEATIGIVLSVKKIQGKEKIALMVKNGFRNITYAELFKSIKQNIGFYITNSNDKYFIYLKDFISTIENMDGNNILNQPLTDFFFENSEKLDELVNLYEEFNNRIVNIQNQHISSLKDTISQRTSKEWWVWGGFDLGYSFKVDNHKLGIESHYKKGKRNPIGIFNIMITTWNVKDWNFFKENLVQLFPNNSYEQTDGRGFLYIEPLINAEEDQIVDKLNEIFQALESMIHLYKVGEMPELN